MYQVLYIIVATSFLVSMLSRPFFSEQVTYSKPGRLSAGMTCAVDISFTPKVCQLRYYGGISGGGGDGCGGGGVSDGGIDFGDFIGLTTRTPPPVRIDQPHLTRRSFEV